jgi:hypothetical protein
LGYELKEIEKMGLNDREDRLAADALIKTSVNAATSVPTAITSGTEINADSLKGARYLNITGVVRNAGDTAEGAADLYGYPCFWMRDKEAWRIGAVLKFPRQATTLLANTDGTETEIHQIIKPQGATRIFLHVPAAAAGSVLHYEIEIDT